MTAQSKKIHQIRAQHKIYVTRTNQLYKPYFAKKISIFSNPVEISNLFKKDLKAGKQAFWDHLSKLKHESDDFINDIQRIASYRSVLLLCFCEDASKCHRTVLAEWLVLNFSDLFIAGEFL